MSRRSVSLPGELWEALEKRAARERRSVSQQLQVFAERGLETATDAERMAAAQVSRAGGQGE